MANSLDIKDGDVFEAKNVEQIVEFLDPILRSAIRDKRRDLSDGDTPVSFEYSWVETLSTSSGDDTSVNTGNTTASYDSNAKYYYGDTTTVTDGFSDSTEYGPVNAADPDGFVTIHTYNLNGQRIEGSIEHEWTTGQSDQNTNGTFRVLVNYSGGAQETDENDGTEGPFRPDGEFFTKNYNVSAGEVDNIKVQVNVANLDDDFYVKNFTADTIDILNSGVLETNTIISTTKNITQAYIHLLGPNTENMTLDVSVDGGTNYDITGVSPNTVIDTSSITNTGNNLSIKANWNDSSQEIEAFAVKAFTQ